MNSSANQESFDQIDLVRAILEQVLQDSAVQVYVFGSRAGSAAHTNKVRIDSDLDLLLKGRTALPFEQIAHLKEAFEQSNLRYQVDLVDYHRASKEFLSQIQPNMYRIL